MLPLFSCASLTSWASKDVVWSNMLEKDKAYTRDVHMMEKHPHLQPKMRAILLDWLMEVCGPSLMTSRRVFEEANVFKYVKVWTHKVVGRGSGLPGPCLTCLLPQS